MASSKIGRILTCTLFGCWAMAIQAGSITVGQGSSLDLGSAVFQNPAHELINHGTLDFGESSSLLGNFANTASADAAGAQIQIVGDWSNTGLFTAGNSLVQFVDGGSGTSLILGSSNFNALTAITNTGKVLAFEAGQEQGISSRLELIGAAGNLLTIVSTAPGQEALTRLSDAATQQVDFVDVSDNHGVMQVIAPGEPVDYNSIRGPNVRGWFSLPLFFPIPSLNLIGLFAMAFLMLMTMAYRQQRKGTQA
jgi:hypothetical protein